MRHRLINAAECPVIIAGIEIIFGFGLRERSDPAWPSGTGSDVRDPLGQVGRERAASALSGGPEGAMGREEDPVRRYVEESDCVDAPLGTFMTDINLGSPHTAHLDPARCIYVHQRKAADPAPSLPRPPCCYRLRQESWPRPNTKRSRKPAVLDEVGRGRALRAQRRTTKITMKRLFQRINQTLGDNIVVVADVRRFRCLPPRT